MNNKLFIINNLTRTSGVACALLATLALSVLPVSGQFAFTDSWKTVPTAKAGPMPRAKDGHADLSGFYQHRTGAPWDIQDHKQSYASPPPPASWRTM